MTIEVLIEKIAGEGRGLGYADGKAVFVTGALPGELVQAEITRSKSRWMDGVLVKVLKPSPHRRPALETHFVSCSPWQSVDYDYQVELKHQILVELVGRPGLELGVTEFVAAPEPLGYRNKLDFAVSTDMYGKLELAVHGRSSSTQLVASPDGCVLGSLVMNQVANGLLGVLDGMELSDKVVGIIIRSSRSGDGLVGVVELAARAKRDWSSLLKLPQLQGVVVMVRRSHNQHQVVWHGGVTDLTDQIANVVLKYPWDGFFQVNLPVFERALAAILTAVPTGARVVDLYGGVGAIGLPVAAKAESVLGVEVNASSVDLANRNALANEIQNYEAILAASEHLDPKLLEGVDVVIVDPPRAGLHARVVDYLAESAVATIIYLSCNPSTQVRDSMMLANAGYTIGSVTGYDFYPGTLHMESMAILRRAKA